MTAESLDHVLDSHGPQAVRKVLTLRSSFRPWQGDYGTELLGRIA